MGQRFESAPSVAAIRASAFRRARARRPAGTAAESVTKPARTAASRSSGVSASSSAAVRSRSPLTHSAYFGADLRIGHCPGLRRPVVPERASPKMRHLAPGRVLHVPFGAQAVRADEPHRLAAGTGRSMPISCGRPAVRLPPIWGGGKGHSPMAGPVPRPTWPRVGARRPPTTVSMSPSRACDPPPTRRESGPQEPPTWTAALMWRRTRESVSVSPRRRPAQRGRRRHRRRDPRIRHDPCGIRHVPGIAALTAGAPYRYGSARGVEVSDVANPRDHSDGRSAF